MVARTLIVARKVCVSKEVSKPVKSKIGWTKSLVGGGIPSLYLSVTEKRDSNGISGFGEREWEAVRDDAVVEEEEEREERGWRE